MKNKILVLALSLMTAQAFAAEPLKADREAVNASCSADAQTAGCGSEVVGKGLLKCLHNYKKAHKEFKFSDSCKSAMKKLKEDKKEFKSAKK
jgi:hypothetical protein